jgi:dTDP-4-dehydrorhamnose 3,5-epimerase
MKFLPTTLPDVMIVEPDVFRDSRGWFLETYHGQKYRDGGIQASFVQDNCSSSVKHTLRGLHAQVGNPQGKLIQVIHGHIFDVAVDIRRGSPTFLNWVGVELDGDRLHQLYIPPGFAHGFCVLSEAAIVNYKCTDFYNPQGELTIRWNEGRIGVAWPVQSPLLSPKDAAGQSIGDLMAHLPEFHP